MTRDDPYTVCAGPRFSGKTKPSYERIRDKSLEKNNIELRKVYDSNIDKIKMEIDPSKRLIVVRLNPETTLFEQSEQYFEQLLKRLKAQPEVFFKTQPAAPTEDVMDVETSEQQTEALGNELPIVYQDEVKKAFVECFRISTSNNEDYMGRVRFNKEMQELDKVKMQVQKQMGRFGSFYSIKGPDTLLYKDLLPQNVTKTGQFRRPKFNRTSGWNYTDSERNAKTLSVFQHCIDEINALYRQSVLVSDNPPLDSEYGTIGWNVPFDEPQWLREIFGKDRQWNPRFNPEILPSPTGPRWMFKKCAISTVSNERAAKFLNDREKYGSKVWQSLFEKSIGLHNNMNNQERRVLAEFVNDKSKNAAFMGWSRHARYMFKDDNAGRIYVYDPWMQNLKQSKKFRALQSAAAQEFGYTVEFVPHSPDQAGEGSCTAFALMRAILVAEFGREGATMRIPPEYAVLTSRLISTFRR